MGRLVLARALFGCVVIAAWAAPSGMCAAQPPRFDGRRAYEDLVRICRLGPRSSGSPGMARQQHLLTEHFSRLGARVAFQSFDTTHPLTGGPVRLNNMIVSWDPDAEERILLCCHYDTRPYPDRDRLRPRGVFVGANDGASGVAVLMELGRSMAALRGRGGDGERPTGGVRYGVDFVFFDAEEFVFGPDDAYFLGSTHFAEQYRRRPPKHRYLCGVLFDMVADRHLRIHMEKNSLQFAPRVTRSIFRTAQRLRIREFVPTVRHTVNDDHIPLNRIAGIPTCDLIDFDYPAWHTTRDTPEQCSASSLQKVGSVISQWLWEGPPRDAVAAE
ncbi:MAG: M28 family peptidase [Planctomycetota bacterium]|nr:MAG: M28 family peptidase [Planctomycetota bacterium]